MLRGRAGTLLSRDGAIVGYQRMRLINLSLASHFLSGALVLTIGVLLAFSIGAPLEGEFTCSGRPAAAKIFEGITYGCEQLVPSEEARGVVHWVRINVTV